MKSFYFVYLHLYNVAAVSIFNCSSLSKCILNYDVS